MDEEAPAISATGARIRPLGIVVVVLLSIARVLVEASGLLLPETTGPLSVISGGSTIPDFPPSTPEWFLAQAGTVALIVLTAVSAVGLWRLRAWGWSLALIIAGVVLVIDLGWWYAAQPRYVGMFLNMIVVFYLNQRDVRTIFLPSST